MQHELELFPGTVLRSMQQSDVARAAELDRECPVQGQVPCPAGVFAARLNQSGFYQFIVEVGGNAVGVVVIKIDDEKEEMDFLKICLTDAGRGLGPLVIERIKQFGKECGADHLIGRCPPGLFPFYEKLGAVKTGELPHFFGVGKPAVALRAEL